MNDTTARPTTCDRCTSGESELLYEVRDLHLHTPGVHRLVRCRQCGLLWLEVDADAPCEEHSTPDDTYAPHRVTNAGDAGVSRTRQRLKIVALAQRRGYPMPAASPVVRFAGTIMAWLLAHRLDHVPRFLPDGRLLDAGSGAGQYVAAMRALGWRAIGLEPATQVSRQAARHGRQPLVAGRIEDAPFAGDTFDVLTLWHTLEHTASPRSALIQARRLLRKSAAGSLLNDTQGVLMLETPNVASGQARLFGHYWFHLDAPRHRFHFTPATLRAYLTQCGFRRIRVRHLPSSVGITGSLQAVWNRLTGRRGNSIRESRLLQWLVWPLAVIEAMLGHGGCIQFTASAIPHVARDAMPTSTGSNIPATFSVVIVSWNCWPDLRRCLESLRPALAGLASEIIVVDNASSDGTTVNLQAEFPEVRTVEMAANAGFATAANRGCEISAGEYVWVLNPDTVVPETTANTLVQALQEHPDAGVVGPRILHPDGTPDSRSARKFPTLLTEWLEKCGLRRLAVRTTHIELREAGCQSVPLLSGAAMCVRRAALEEIGGLDETFLLYGEDLDLCRRLAAAGWQILHCSAAQLIHTGERSSRQIRDEAGIQAILSMAHYLDTHHRPIYAGLYWTSMALLSTAKIVTFAIARCLARSGDARRRHAGKVKLHQRLRRALREERRP